MAASVPNSGAPKGAASSPASEQASEAAGSAYPMPMGSAPRVLDLFSGSDSVRKVCDQLGWICISVDVRPSSHPYHIQCDIQDFDVT